jgi:hypothetical protein
VLDDRGAPPQQEQRQSRVEVRAMLAIVTHVQLKPGSEGVWDRAMRDRLRAAEGRPGWVAASSPSDRLSAPPGGGRARPRRVSGQRKRAGR